MGENGVGSVIIDVTRIATSTSDGVVVVYIAVSKLMPMPAKPRFLMIPPRRHPCRKTLLPRGSFADFEGSKRICSIPICSQV